MLAQTIKFGARTVALGLVIGAIIAIFAAVQIPTPDYTVFSQAVGKGYAIMNYWIPGFSVLYNFILLVYGLWITIQVAKFSIAGLALILKVMS